MHGDKALDYLYGLESFGIRLGLESITALLARCGDPHKELTCVHIAGTNGKGSTSAFIAQILQEAGYLTGLYTSPHLVDFEERISINHRRIDTDDVVRLTEWLKQRAYGLELTFFEFTTAMAFKYFFDKKVNMAVIEAGLGGRFDATNVVEPIASVITSVSIDHKEYLGSDIRSIAGEKAGIIKNGVPLISAERKRGPSEVIVRVCAEKKARPVLIDRDFIVDGESRRDFRYRSSRLHLEGLRVFMPGDHHMKNAAMAIAVTEVLAERGFEIREEHIRKGLEHASLPGRVQMVRTRPTVVVDGAHNVEAITNLMKVLRKEFKYERLYVVFGMMRDKEVRKVLKVVIPVADSIILVRPKNPRAMPPSLLADIVRELGGIPTIGGDVAEAIEFTLEKASKADLICVCGSFYTAGEALAHFQRMK